MMALSVSEKSLGNVAIASEFLDSSTPLSFSGGNNSGDWNSRSGV